MKVKTEILQASAVTSTSSRPSESESSLPSNYTCFEGLIKSGRVSLVSSGDQCAKVWKSSGLWDAISVPK